MQLVDIGANLTHRNFDRDREAVIERAQGAGVTRMVVTGASEADSRAAHALAASHPGQLFATAGIHPHNARHWDADVAATLRALAVEPEVVALGEMGLDFNRDFSPRPRQEEALEAQLELAVELEMPVFMHERDARERFVQILTRYRDRLGAVVIHCFTGTGDDLTAYLDLDLHIGITGWICDERRGLHLRQLVHRVPLERLMLETDAPYLLPRDLEPRPRSRRNEPAHLPHILQAVASCLDLPAAAVAEATTRNACVFFGLDT